MHTSDHRVSGVLALFHRGHAAVAKGAVQTPPPGSGMPAFEFWTPERRPGGRNLAIRVEPPLDRFGVEQLRTGVARPTCRPNTWVADPGDPAPRITLAWNEPQLVGRVELVFDTDRDHPLESVLMGHPETVAPFCVRDVVLRDETGRELAALSCNHATRRTVLLDPPATVRRLVIQLAHPGSMAPAALVGVRCHAPATGPGDETP